MRARMEACLGIEHRWLARLARRVQVAHPCADGLPPDRLARFLEGDPRLKRMWSRRYGLVHPRERFLPVPPLARRRISVHRALPPWSTAGDLAAHLGITGPVLDGLADVRDLHRTGPRHLRNYRHRWLAPRSSAGSARLLEAPKDRLRRAQRALLRDVLDPVAPHPAAHGFVRGGSVLRCAQVHAGQPVLMRFDLRAFFPSLHRRRVAGLFRALGYPSAVAWHLACLCTTPTPPDVLATLPTVDASARRWARACYLEPHLPQGAPTSPALANLCAYGLDARLSGLAKSFGARYTRYADDLVLSGPRQLPARTLVDRVVDIVRDEGFTLNPAKTRVVGPGAPHRCLGLAVDVHPAVPRRERERLEAILVNCARHGPESQNRAGHPHWQEHLRGRVAWVASVNARHGARLKALYERISW